MLAFFDPTGALLSASESHGQLPQRRSAPAPATVKFRDQYRLGASIAEGTFGKVCAARTRLGWKARAVKILDLRKDASVYGAPVDRKLAEIALKECKVWSRAGKHPNLVQLYDVYVERNFCYLVLELCDGGDLSRDGLGDHLVGEPGHHGIFHEMLKGLAHVHASGLVHRDIKPHNFLLGGPKNQTVKLADFGLCAAMPRQGLMEEQTGTPPFMSPEMLYESGYDFKTDIWSVGVTIYWLLFGLLPYPAPIGKDVVPQSVREVLDATRERGLTFERLDEDWPRHNRGVEDFVGALMEREAQNRCTAEEALALPSLQAFVFRFGMHFAPPWSVGKGDFSG